MLEAKSTLIRHHEELAEVRDGAWELRSERTTLLLDLEDGLASEAAEEDALHGVLEDFEHMREFEDERAGLEARDREQLGGFREDEVMEFKDLARFLLDFHVVFVTIVANPKLFFGDCGGLREFSKGFEIIRLGNQGEIFDIEI